MTLFGRKLGRASGDTGRDIRTVFDYLAYLVERLEYSGNQTDKQMTAQNEAMETMGAKMAAMEKRLAALEQTATAAAQEEEG